MSDPVTATRAAAPPPPRRARMLHYAYWQLRDYLFERGLPTLLLAGIFGFLGGMPLRAVKNRDVADMPRAMILKYGSAAAAHAAIMDETSRVFLRQFIGAIVFLGALFAMNGLVSNDRKNGYYRFLFAKPVTPERYYGQAFALHAAGFLASIVLLLLLWGALIAPAISIDILATMWLMYLCYAGIAFLLTAAARWDWLSLVAVTFASTLAWDRFGASTAPAAKLLYLLPPLTRTDSLYAAATDRSVALNWHTLLWLAGYGMACFVAGLLVLRYRRLAIP